MALKKKAQFINFDLTSNNTVAIQAAKNLASQLTLGDRLLPLKLGFILCLLFNLKRGYAYKRNIIIPQDKEFYRKNKNNSRPKYQTYDIVVGVIKELESKGYIKYQGHVIKFATSEYYPERSLLPYFSGYSMNDVTVFPPTKNVILRKLAEETDDYDGAKKYVDIDYYPTQLTQIMSRDLFIYNRLREYSSVSLKDLPSYIFNKHIDEFLSRWSVDDVEAIRYTKASTVTLELQKSYLVRIFNLNFRRGGRFYRGVESNMPEELRRHVHIDSNPTVELDYSGHHLRMLYHLKKIDLKTDPYAVEPNMTPGMRDVYKTVSLIGINAKSNKSALLALYQKFEEDDDLAKCLPDNSHATRQKLINNFKTHNKRIAEHLFKQKCHQLMNLDSKISNDILMFFAKKRILVLCIHDSYIIEKQYAKELLKVMRNAYRARLGFNPVIK